MDTLKKVERNKILRIAGIFDTFVAIIASAALFLTDVNHYLIVGTSAMLIFVTILLSYLWIKKEKEKVIKKEKIQLNEEKEECSKRMYHIQRNQGDIATDVFIKNWREFYRTISDKSLTSSDILKKWIDFLRKKSSDKISNTAFTIPELYYIYTISEFFFTQDEIIEGSEKHFTNSKNWFKDLSGTFEKDKRNHIMNANFFISKNLKNLKSLKKIKFLDFGSGLLSSLLYIAHHNNFRTINYLGIDINEKFVKISNAFLNEEFKENDKDLMLAINDELDKSLDIKDLNKKFFKNFKNFKKIWNNVKSLMTDFVIKENLNDLELHKSLLNKFEGKVDLITANYCLHHLPNPILIEKNILNKNCFYLFGEDVNNWHFQIKEAISSFLYSHKSMDSFIKEMNNYSKGYIKKPEMSTIISEYLENDRVIIFELISKLLKVNGKFVLSDPDGFSDWNASQIYSEDWSHAIAHFSNIKYDLELIEKNTNLKFSEAYLQMRKNDGEIVTISLSKTEILNCSFMKIINEHKDINLGYIIGFEKMEK